MLTYPPCRNWCRRLFLRGRSADSCVCVGIDVAIFAIVGADARDAAGVSVGCGVAVIWALSLRSLSSLGLGVGVAAAISVALVFTLMEKPCWPLRFAQRVSERGVAL